MLKKLPSLKDKAKAQAESIKVEPAKIVKPKKTKKK